MISHYVNAILKKEHYNDAIDEVVKTLPFINKEIERLSANDLKDGFYYSILYSSGMSNYNLREYKIATPIFKELVTYDSKNDNYKKWFAYSKLGERLLIARALNILFCAMLLLDIFIGKKYLSPSEREVLDGTAFIGIMSIVGYDYYVKRSYRKPKTK